MQRYRPFITFFFARVGSRLFRQPCQNVNILHVYDIAFNYKVDLISARPPLNIHYV
jgi:hypothetical protein